MPVVALSRHAPRWRKFTWRYAQIAILSSPGNKNFLTRPAGWSGSSKNTASRTDPRGGFGTDGDQLILSVKSPWVSVVLLQGIKVKTFITWLLSCIGQCVMRDERFSGLKLGSEDAGKGKGRSFLLCLFYF